MPGAQQTIIINATPDKVFQVITDYANYPTFLKEVSSCVVDSRDGNSVVSTFKVDIKVKGDWLHHPFNRNTKYQSVLDVDPR